MVRRPVRRFFSERDRGSGRARAPALSVFLLVVSALAFQAPAQSPEDPALVGQWSPVIDWPVVSVHTHLLPTGDVLFWAYDDSDGFYRWDPATEAVTVAADPVRNVFCSGHSFLPDGSLLISGGHVRDDIGLRSASIYDPFLDSWTNIPDMNAGRWYPSSTTLGNGDVLVTSGAIFFYRNRLPQVYQVDQNSWRDLTGAELVLPLYPRTFLAPNGKVFVATATSRYLNVMGTGAWSVVSDRLIGGRDDHGSAVLYDDGKVLWTGGGDLPTETSEIIDLEDLYPSWQFTGSMAQPRRQNNATLLPDGTVLATGGSSSPGFDEPQGAVLQAEIWDPETGFWSTMASGARYRGYHSTALLLPDGRVLSSGGDDEPNAEIYSPPYLFRGPRPVVGNAPTSVALGETFFVETADAALITDVNWIRLGSLTHGQNWSQRINRLPFSQTTGGLTVTAPFSENLSPPGYYMLFILDDNGVPSESKIVQLVPEPASWLMLVAGTTFLGLLYRRRARNGPASR